MFSKATEKAPQDYLLWANLGDAQHYHGANEMLAPQSYARSAQLARAHLGVNPDDGLARAALAYALVRLGDSAASRTELAQLPTVDSDNAYLHYYAALVHGQLGETDAAVDRLRSAIDFGFPRSVLRVAPELDALRADPRVVALSREPTLGAVFSKSG
jgi:serine/threonine-protein kinase